MIKLALEPGDVVDPRELEAHPWVDVQGERKEPVGENQEMLQPFADSEADYNNHKYHADDDVCYCCYWTTRLTTTSTTRRLLLRRRPGILQRRRLQLRRLLLLLQPDILSPGF